MEGYKAPPDMVFQGNMAEQWKIWIQQFTLCMIAAGKNKKPEEEKVAMLLNMMGLEAIRIYNTFDFAAEEDKQKYDKVIKKFEEYCTPRKNLVYEHYNFFSRNQHEHETFDEFLTSLKKLAGTCEFAERDVMIRDRIVLGIKYKHLQEKMLNESDLQMEAAIQHCRNYERTKDVVQNIQMPKNEVTMAEVTRKPKWRSHKTTTSNQVSTAKSYPIADKKNNLSKKCSKCGNNHEYYKCPAFGKKCLKCGRLNHYASMCRSKTINTLATNETNISEDEVIIYSVGNNDQNVQWTLTLYINGIDVLFKLDTGAQVNVINYELYKRLRNKSNLYTDNKHLISYTGHKLKVMGVADMKCKVNQKVTIQQFYIVDDSSSKPILGLQTIQELNLLTKNTIENIVPVSVINQSSASEILERHSQVFIGDGKLDTKYKITLTEDAKPLAVPPRSIPIAIRDDVKLELDRMEKEGIIRKVTEPTPWVSPITIVRKEGKKPRICMDPRHLNKFIQRETCWIPTVNSIFADIGTAKVYTVLDASNAFHQIQLDDSSAKLCTIATPFGRYSYTRLPYGLSSAPEVFQQTIATMFEGIQGVTNYIDDIIIYGNTMEDHNITLEKVLVKACDHGLKLSRNKTQLATDQITLLGYIITQQGITVDPKKTEAIKKMKPPTTLKELQRFLGIITYLSRHLEGLSQETAPLRAILSKHNMWQWERNGPEQQAFQKLKDMVTNAPVLRHFDSSKSVTLSVDASQYGIGAVLMQEANPVAYASATLTQTQQRYNQIEKELLAIVYAVEHFNYYVLGRLITIETDHRPLLAIVRKPLEQLTPRLQRLVMRLMRYTVTLRYVPGRSIQVADALSRDPTNQLYDTQYLDTIVTICPIEFRNTTRMEKLKLAGKEDDTIKQVIEYTINGWPTQPPKNNVELMKYWTVQSELTSNDEMLYKNKALCIPSILRKEMLELIHESHQGVVACKRKVKDIIYWPGISQDIESKVLSCEKCQLYSRANESEETIAHDIPELPWDKIGIDFKTQGDKNYLVIVDYHSKFIVLDELRNKTAEMVILSLQKTFSVLGLPTVIVSDNGQPFDSHVYLGFLKECDIVRVTSSPTYAQSNGMIERHIQTVKAMLIKLKTEPLNLMKAIMNYNSTPKYNLPSPAEMLMGRRIRTRMPMTLEQRIPKYQVEATNTQLQNNRAKMHKKGSNKHMTKIKEGQRILVQMAMRNWIPGIILREMPYRSYTIKLQSGSVIRRNRKQIKPFREIMPDIDLSPPVHPPETKPPEVKIKTQQAEKAEQPYITRRGRVVRKPERLDM